MQQLIMRWTNDGTPAGMPEMPDDMSIRAFPDVSNAVEEWLDIVQCGLSEKRENADFYRKYMTECPGYREDKCFFVFVGDRAAASFTVICNEETREGYLHMVACKEAYRGRGIGTRMNEYALYVLKREGMTHAQLTTDDFRIPAIKSYLRAGFVPDESTDDFRRRWEAIREKLA